MRYWWVNQNQTYEHEVGEGFLWSPKTSKGGSRNQFYDNMTEVSVGDLVFSFKSTLIKAVGIAEGQAETAPNPFGDVGAQWSDEGWLVPVNFHEAENPIRPKDHIDDLRPMLAAKYAPLQDNGNGNQGVYLAEISSDMAEYLLGQLSIDPQTLISSDSSSNEADDKAERALKGRTDIGPTFRQQLVKARRGQGIFKSNVLLNEKRCRVTGVADPAFLIASHIKPWRLSSDEEKLDGCNGLVLAPHIDWMFDKGWISFSNDGALLTSPKLPGSIANSWGLNQAIAPEPFLAEQSAYLAFHRAEIFDKDA